ncbi:cellulose binding domain-containing protein [Actinocorallia sp. API 0066]|uniref:cellulose binding domain-containing protein n=1 Tax=Actinocorallia sp. API 0066 TaxID=2896846 RepID=UPI001E4179C4|nr:cellulose binding domain-containing protein [Actinocorallia sp. API 0066]MCD0448311.1 cellulose binding domain-containing protein [Actinocorallia sp. API 0066]
MGGGDERATRRDLPLPRRKRQAEEPPVTVVESAAKPLVPPPAAAQDTAEQTIVDRPRKPKSSGDRWVAGRALTPQEDAAQEGVLSDQSEATVVDSGGAAREGNPPDQSEATVVDGGLALPGLPPRPEDVVFGSAAGAEDVTGPQPPLPVLMGLLGRGEVEASERDTADVRVHPPISPVLAEALYSPPRPRRKVGLVIPGVIVTGLLVIGAVAALLWPDAPRARPSAPGATGAAATPAPAQGDAQGVSGVTPEGVEVVYETVEVATGYFEGTITLTNGTGETLPSWTLSFTYPGAYIRNVWGGELTDPGNEVTIVNDGNTAPIAPGASVEVRFGGGGAPSRPENCTFGGTPCGF